MLERRAFSFPGYCQRLLTGQTGPFSFNVFTIVNMRVTTRSRQPGAIPAPNRYIGIFLFGLLVFIGIVDHSDGRQHGHTVNKKDEKFDSEAINRLSRVFGISRVPVDFHHRAPPQYMVELFNSITDVGGLVKSKTPYDADVVRSFPDRATTERMFYQYNVSYLEDQTESILRAEFRLFKMRPKPSPTRESKPPHIIEMKIFQVLDPSVLRSPSGVRLLQVKRISSHTHGWLVFKVNRAVEDWANGTRPNHGFLVTTTSLKGVHVNGSYIRFAQRHEHHDSKQPVLVVFTDDGRTRHPNYVSPNDEDYVEIKEDIQRREMAPQTPSQKFREAIRLLNERDRAEFATSRILQAVGYQEPTRKKRAANRPKASKKRDPFRSRRALDYRRRHRKSCNRYEMYVNFEEIGWSGWIISPKGYNAYHCSGECPFPLGQNQKPTNHATVQSIVHALQVGKDVSTPCCVPNKLYSISLLYFDDEENVILKQYDDMVAATCGCH